MFLKLHDQINDREEDYEVGIQSYRGLWATIDEIINRHHYSCVGYIVPKVNREERLVTIRWVEKPKQLSESFIEVHECEDYLLNAFVRNIQHHEECRRKKDESEKNA